MGAAGGKPITWDAEAAAQVHGWARQMRWELGPPPATFKEAYCCTQFAVSAARIRRRSHLFWRSLLADLLDPEMPAVCKLSGHMLELFWGYLLGEPADFQCRRDLWGHRGPPPHDGSSDTSEKSPAPWPRQSRRRGAMRFRSGG